MCKCNVFAWTLLAILVGAVFVVLSVFSPITTFILYALALGAAALLLGFSAYAAVNQCCAKANECFVKVLVYSALVAIAAAVFGLLLPLAFPVLTYVLTFFATAGVTLGLIALVKIIFQLSKEKCPRSL